MDASPSTDIALFEGFRLDARSGALFRRDQRGVYAPVAIGSRALDILLVLVERPGDLVSRAELLASVWPGTVIEDSNLNVQIAALRRVLDDGRAEGSCIQTVSGRGYRFMAPVSRAEPSAPSAFFPPSGDGAEGTIASDRQPEIAPSAPGYPEELAVPIAGGRSRPWWGTIAGVIAALVLIAAAVAAWREPWLGEAPSVPRLSIVVLPFANLSNDPSQQYFADGITEDLTTDLSRLSHMMVISRASAFTYKDRSVNAKQIGRELGVRYVLEGSVQRSGKTVRISAQLIDAETDTHFWADRFDREIGDLLVRQDQITGRIGNALNIELIDEEAGRRTENPDALDYIFRGRAAANRPASRQNYAETISMLERALALDPQSAEAQGLLANALTSRVLDDMTDTAAADLKRAEALAGKALATGMCITRRLRITPAARCCARSTDTRTPFPNTRRYSHSIPT
jgi:TolB-like protein/DNA-binding winged helix-turn-helix (wHTH) protein